MGSPTVESTPKVVLGTAKVLNKPAPTAETTGTQPAPTINMLVHRLSTGCTEAESRPYIGNDPNVNAALSDRTVYRKDGKELGYSIHLVRNDGTKTNLVYTGSEKKFYLDKDGDNKIDTPPVPAALAKNHKHTPDNQLIQALAGRRQK